MSQVVDAIAPPRFGGGFRRLLTSSWASDLGDGVALAAIQGLNAKLEKREREKDDRIRKLEQSVAELKELVNRLAGQRNGGGQ